MDYYSEPIISQSLWSAQPDCPFRIIISSISPLYALAIFLHGIIIRFSKVQSHINNSFELVNRLSQTHIDTGFCLISLDIVVSLFINVPIDLAIECLSNRWNFICNNCNIIRKNFWGQLGLRFYLFHDNQTYKQNFGISISSPLSPVITDIVMQELETGAGFHYISILLFQFTHQSVSFSFRL